MTSSSRGEGFKPEHRRYDSLMPHLCRAQFGAGMIRTKGADSAQNPTGFAVLRHAGTQACGFARHLRTKVHEEGGVWAADAVYTKSPTLLYGPAKSDADVARADCEQSGIPMV